MTRVCYEYNGHSYTLTCRGHAGYAPAGQDIVCAGISALCGALELTLENLRQAGHVRNPFCRVTQAYFRACAKSADESNAVETAFETVYNGLCRISEAYPDFLQCRKTILKKEDTQ